MDGVAAKAGDGLGRWVAREDDMTEEARWKRKLAQFVAEMPGGYDQRYRINFALVPPRAAGAGGGGGALGEREVREAKRALLLFEDYRQRKALAKIRKMREDQRALLSLMARKVRASCKRGTKRNNKDSTKETRTNDR